MDVIILRLLGEKLSKLVFLLNPNYLVENVSQQNFSIISSAHGLFWIEWIASYLEIQNGSKYLRLKKNEVE